MDIDEEIVVDTKKDQLDILKRFKQDKSDRGLANLYPDLAKEWVSEKNNGLMPNQFTPGSLLRLYGVAQSVKANTVCPSKIV